MYHHIVKPNETLWSISEDYRVPFQSLIQANHIVNPNMINAGQSIIIPGLPNPNQIPYSIHVSVKNKTLTLMRNQSPVKTYPIAVGKILTQTPIGDFVVINKAPNPGGPFGTMWMSLSKKHYGIHGTNNPSSIGKSVSKGCIRMYNSDVEELARTVPIGTRVFIR
ncbi:L,D-transpeptidase family protein [Cytobacillus praedii]|uniref:LysM peptidoglycan-binding domain-containing protein n=1 Tax=Cytobacillus praedii TaxID=1742358 RepID=A0A4R1APD6_9BACI|nr:L,D-transpeptidase family protein [Cytobacillus praedii]MED3552800.1 L,D-transpeptidase family protein [Cytobacillus praedii]TCJ01643.1 LysM peptidoglycan-binding domain-containing protein [Cytobacillus praedii]